MVMKSFSAFMSSCACVFRSNLYQQEKEMFRVYLVWLCPVALYCVLLSMPLF